MISEAQGKMIESSEFLSLLMTFWADSDMARLYPFTSHEALCFGRNDTYPFNAIDAVITTFPGGFEVWTLGGASLGRGRDASQALDIVKSRI